MSQQKMITVAAEDVCELVVGSLAEFRHKRLMVNDSEYREVVEHQPATLQEMFGLPKVQPMREVLGL